jgi:uncharacterized repeat protein (TIGR01451 family)
MPRPIAATRFALGVAAALLLFADADAAVQLAKLTASDGVAGDQLAGTTVLSTIDSVLAMSGDTIVAGAPSANGRQGAAYVFVKGGAGWATMTQTAKLTASDGAPFHEFGTAVATDGDTIIVGAPFHNVAYVFVKPAGGWTSMTETARLTAAGPTSGFGGAIDMTATTAVVGASFENGNRGAAYVFVKPVGGWITMTQTAKLTASDPTGVDIFGECVAISGDTIAVGAPFHASNQGQAYVFVKPVAGWTTATETAKLAPLAVGGGRFALSLAMSGDTVVAGEPNDLVGGISVGSAYLFVKSPGGWVTMSETARLTPSDGALGDSFAWGVGISGDTVVIGAPFHAGQGAGYLFVKPAGGWSTTSGAASVFAADAAPGDQFGWSAAISGDTFVVGAPFDDVGTNADQGSAYVFGPSSADLGIVKTTSATAAYGTMPVTYTISVSNAGPGTAVNVTVTDALPAGASFVGASGSGWSCGVAANVVTCTLPLLAVGAAAPITLTINAPATAVNTNLVNSATVASASSDPVATNNSSSATVALFPAAAIPTLDARALLLLAAALAAVSLRRS